MKIRKTVIILSILLVAGIIESCKECKTFCFIHSYMGIEVKNLDNRGADIQKASNSVLKTAYGIRVELQLNETDSCTVQSFSPNLHLLQSAYAMSVCDDRYYYKVKEPIVAIRIITLNDFDETHFAGTDIAHYFRLRGSYQDINEYIASLDDQRDYYERTLEYKEDIDILLMTPPATGTIHKFKIQVELSDGSVLEKETDEIELI